ncbi:MAG: TIGR03085 family metal-binding protein [Nocardioides sp.]
MTNPASESLARRERYALCDLALQVGPEAPTRCAGWDVGDLIAHLVVRERRPHAAVGIVVSKLAPITERAMAKVKAKPFAEVVASIREPKLPFSLSVLEPSLNTVEWFVHHEDIRRAQPDWTSRRLNSADEAELFSKLGVVGKMLARKAHVPITIALPTGRTTTLRSGAKPVTITGPVGELTMFLSGRTTYADLTFDGPGEAVEQVRSAQFEM